MNDHLNHHGTSLTDPGALKRITIPPSLQANVDRHCANLAALIDTLGKAGVDEATIEASVTLIIASYQAELLLNLKTLHRDAADG